MHNVFERTRLHLQTETQAQNADIKMWIKEEYFKTIYIKIFEQQLARSHEFKPKANLNRN